MRSASVRRQMVDERIVSFDEALAIVQAKSAEVHPGPTEKIGIRDSLGRALCTAVKADRDQPPFDRSTRDGFAVRAEDAMARAWLAVAGEIAAGSAWTGPLPVDEAVAIMTGAPVPDDADSVVMLEHVERSGTHKLAAIRLMEGRKLEPGDNIVPRASEAIAGDIVLEAGIRLDAAAVALAAACGAATLEVFAKPTVSILATGDELVDVTEEPGPQQIRNSNSYGLAALVTEFGGIPHVQKIAPDEREALERSIEEARKADLMLLSGGVSMGEYDLVEEVLRSMGAEFFFTGVKMQPGKPLVFGRLPERGEARAVYFFGLPGNPVSTQVTFSCFGSTLLSALGGCFVEGPPFAQATLVDAIDPRPGITRVLPARLTSNRAKPEVRLVVWQGSGDMAANARANCYAVLPGDVPHFRPGDVITILQR
ncbi:MAG TPA: gephyrin-like molybdotransferase Glp [Edaphobacter sp.]|nr:gephyrin-like molybdotransferase Glp [Edaphobacter sp.]